MCRYNGPNGELEYDCNYIDSPRRIWVEIDSQILNALFCVTGFGLIPWRFRDLYYLLQYRLLGKYEGLQVLGGIHRSWLRLPGSQDLPVDVVSVLDLGCVLHACMHQRLLYLLIHISCRAQITSPRTRPRNSFRYQPTKFRVCTTITNSFPCRT